MLLLYHSRIHYVRCIWLDLHSTMLLLYRMCLFYSRTLTNDLHSTMLLLYRCSSTETLCNCILFTFHYASTLSICLMKWSWKEREFTFHYASTLSFIPDYFVEVDFFIYIPLCFYFILIREMRQEAQEIIYIPLCFYFITVVITYPLTFLHNLHSTMLLLYQVPEDRWDRSVCNLHSTMLLLYHVFDCRELIAAD